MANLEEHITVLDNYLGTIRTQLKKALTDRNITVGSDKIHDLLKCFLSFDPVPTGTVIASYARTAPAGYLKCDGSSYNKSEYPRLFDCIEGSSSTKTSFNVPDLRGRFIQGKMDTEKLGDTKNAGLPNIKGTLMVDDSIYGKPNDYYTGVFTKGKYNGSWDAHSQLGGYASGWINFDASTCNRIYKDECNTVQPPAVCLNYFIKY